MTEKTILLVEDNSDDIMLIQRLFERNRMINGLDVVTDGEEALDYLFGRGLYQDRDIRFQPILILLDTRLPKLNGLEVLQHIRSRPETEDLPLIIMNNDKEEIKEIKGYELDVKAFLAKPFSFAKFTKAARKAGLHWLLTDAPMTPEQGD